MPWTKPYKPSSNKRLDPEIYQQSGRVTFITICAFARTLPFTLLSMNQMIIEILRTEQQRQNSIVYTYCLMPNHLHFLISPAKDGVSILDFTHQYKGKTTNLSWKLGWKGILWQPRFYDHIVRAEEDLQAIAEYILENPVRKGLVASAEDWQWSGNFSPLPIGP